MPDGLRWHPVCEGVEAADGYVLEHDISLDEDGMKGTTNRESDESFCRKVLYRSVVCKYG